MTIKLDIDYIEFSSADRAETERFLAAAFGWTFTGYGPSYSSIDNAGIDGGIEQAEGERKPPLVILYAENIDAAEQAVRDAGGVIVREQFDFPGGRRFHFREPGGNEVAIWSGPRDH